MVFPVLCMTLKYTVAKNGPKVDEMLGLIRDRNLVYRSDKKLAIWCKSLFFFNTTNIKLKLKEDKLWVTATICKDRLKMQQHC